MPILCRRQPDIILPLSIAPYTLPNLAGTDGANRGIPSRRGVDHVLFRAETSNGAISYIMCIVPGPFSYDGYCYGQSAGGSLVENTIMHNGVVYHMSCPNNTRPINTMLAGRAIIPGSGMDIDNTLGSRAKIPMPSLTLTVGNNIGASGSAIGGWNYNLIDQNWTPQIMCLGNDVSTSLRQGLNVVVGWVRWASFSLTHYVWDFATIDRWTTVVNGAGYFAGNSVSLAHFIVPVINGAGDNFLWNESNEISYQKMLNYPVPPAFTGQANPPSYGVTTERQGIVFDDTGIQNAWNSGAFNTGGYPMATWYGGVMRRARQQDLAPYLGKPDYQIIAISADGTRCAMIRMLPQDTQSSLMVQQYDSQFRIGQDYIWATQFGAYPRRIFTTYSTSYSLPAVMANVSMPILNLPCVSPCLAMPGQIRSNQIIGKGYL